MSPILQVALDFVDLPRALKLAEEAVKGGADWLEAGTPLIKSVGLDCIRRLREKFPKATIVADMKTMDVGRMEVEMAAKAGANVISILALSSESTIRECVEAAGNYGARIMADLLEVPSVAEKAKCLEARGVDYICLHTSIDEQMQGRIKFKDVRAVAASASIPVAVAGGINSENAVDAVRTGAGIIVVGGAITKADNATEATVKIKKAIEKKIKVKTQLYRRVSAREEDIRETFMKVSCANISDAMHRQEGLKDIVPVSTGKKMVGRAVTVRTYPGDWAKPVEAIDHAPQGSVMVIDAGGVGPAVWGELATHSAIERGLCGVVIDGALRDVEDIRRLNFPAYSALITPAAGEPRGFGEMDIPVTVGGVKVYPGDWIVGDGDGVLVIPREKAVEIANRAMDVLERENRIRREIKDGQTLGQVTELLKWEKK